MPSVCLICSIPGCAGGCMNGPPYAGAWRPPVVPDPVPREPEPTYPCKRCGVLRTKAEGGTTFTVCDECWDLTHPREPSVTRKPISQSDQICICNGTSQTRRCAACYRDAWTDGQRDCEKECLATDKVERLAARVTELEAIARDSKQYVAHRRPECHSLSAVCSCGVYAFVARVDAALGGKR